MRSVHTGAVTLSVSKGLSRTVSGLGASDMLPWATVKTYGDIHAQIRRLRGSLKPQPGEKSATQQLREVRAEDLRLEEAKFERLERWIQRRRQRSS
jgi:hypothetical protein